MSARNKGLWYRFAWFLPGRDCGEACEACEIVNCRNAYDRDDDEACENHQTLQLQASAGNRPVAQAVPAQGRATVAPGARQRYASTCTKQATNGLLQEVADARCSLDELAQRVIALNHDLNTARSDLAAFSALSFTVLDTSEAALELERLAAFKGVTALEVRDNVIVLHAALRTSFEDTLYDLGDWEVNLCSQPDEAGKKSWLTREKRQGFRQSWMDEAGGRCYHYPVYRTAVGVFCFNDQDKTIRAHLGSGRIAEGAELALACMSYVNPDDCYRIPSAFNVAADDPARGKTAFIPNRAAVQRAYTSLCADVRNNRLISREVEVNRQIAAYELELAGLREKRAGLQRSIAEGEARLATFADLDTSLAADEFDRLCDYLVNLAGVMRIDFREGEMVLSVSPRVIYDGHTYDLGDWRIYLGGGQGVGEGEFTFFSIVEERSGRIPPPDNREMIRDRALYCDEICAFIKEGAYVPAATLLVTGLHTVEDSMLEQIPALYRQRDTEGVRSREGVYAA